MRASASLTLPLPRFLADGFAAFAGTVVVVVMLFGGGARQGLWSDIVVEFAAIPLLAWAIARLHLGDVRWLGRWSLVLLCAIVALPLAQLVPLPPRLWTQLPGRGEVIAAYHAAGMALPWLPISLDPAATWQGLISLLPAVAVFLAMFSLTQRARRALTVVILVAAAVSVPVDFLQMMDEAESPLRFYAVTNTDRAVGFFANANHNAALLYCAIPLAAAWLIGLRADRRGNALVFWLLLGIIFAAFVGMALSNSRAGLALGFVAGLSCLALIRRQGGRDRRLFVYALIANVAALLLAFQFGFLALVNKAESTNVFDDLRWPVARVTTQAAIDNMPFGTGFGTFVPIYDMNVPRMFLRDRYINHAHDDWLELWLTGGAPALALVGLFLIWFFVASVQAWSRAPPGASGVDVALARAGSIVVFLLLLHSALDYPLRTAALTVVFAVACALLIQHGDPAQAVAHEPGHRH